MHKQLAKGLVSMAGMPPVEGKGEFAEDKIPGGDAVIQGRLLFHKSFLITVQWPTLAWPFVIILQ